MTTPEIVILQPIQDTESNLIQQNIKSIDNKVFSNVVEAANKLRRSIDSGIEVPMLESKALFQQTKNHIIPHQIVQVLQQQYVQMEDQQTEQSNQWTPLSIYNPTTRAFSASQPPLPPLKVNRKSYVHCILFSLLICICVSLGLAISLHSTNPPFDTSTGPRGSTPSNYQGPPLQIHNISTGTYFGISLDWSIDDPEHLNRDLGYTAAIQDVVFYMDDPFTTFGTVNSSGYLHTVPDVFLWTANLIRGTGAIMSITVIPTIPLSKINDTGIETLASRCKDINLLGIPILLRFAPDMNGNWHPYGQNPSLYVDTFQRVVEGIKNVTNNTATVWSPTSGVGYPFPPSIYTPTLNESRFLQVDTSGDGVLNRFDDPYLPYYPGDEYVDWVGLSMMATSGYHVFPVKKNNKVIASLPTVTSTSTITATSSPTSIPTNGKYPLPVNRADNDVERYLTTPGTIYNFYRDFVQARQKPFLLNVGVGFFRPGSGAHESQVKMAMYEKILGPELLNNYNDIRGIILNNNILELNETTLERFDPSTVVDFSITRNKTVLTGVQGLLGSVNVTGMFQYSNVSSTQHGVFLTQIFK